MGLGCDKEFLDTTPEAQAIKEYTMINWITKIQNFCWAKDTVEKTKRQATDLDRIFVNHIPDKPLVSKLYKKLFKLNNKKTITPIFKKRQKF